jgi:predicted lipase
MTTFDDGRVQGYTETLDDGRLHIHVFGTNQADDVAADFAAMKWFWHGFWVHFGFSRYAGRLLKLWKTWGIDKARGVVLSGHSLGAAVAILAGAYLSRKGWAVEVTVCGCPMVGGILFRWQTRKLKVKRFEVVGDVVTMVPPFGYVHVGECDHIEWNGKDDFQGYFERHQPGAYQPHFPYQL